MGNGDSTQKWKTEMKCGYFTLDVSENYFIGLFEGFFNFIMLEFSIFQLFILILWWK